MYPDDPRYLRVLRGAQEYVTANYSSLLTAKSVYDQVHPILCRRIRTYLENRYAQLLSEQDEDLIERLFEDIAGYGCLGRYLRHLNDDDLKELYEINGTSWESIVLKYQDGRIEFLKDHFLSPGQARDVMQRLADSRGKALDQTNAYAEFDLEQNVRLSAFIPPLVKEETGASFSIRIVRTKDTGNLYFVPEAMSQPMEDFLKTCIEYRIPLIIGGEPGSGKTVLLNHLLGFIPGKCRCGTIEENSRELGGLERRGSDDRLTNQWISLLASGQYAPDDLLYGALRQDYDYLVPQEMRGKEAFTAIEAAHTGMIVTTIHVSALRLIWGRCATLARKKIQDDDATLTRYAMEAFPIAVFMRRGNDDRFRVMEIAEAIQFDYAKGRPVYQTIFAFRTKENIVRDDGKTQVVGEFKQTSGISDGLADLFRNHGAPEDLIVRFALKG